MKQALILFFMVWILFTQELLHTMQQAHNPYIITFFFRPYKEFDQLLKSHEDLTKYLAHPGNISHAILDTIALQSVAGIYVTYAGTVAHSNNDGQIIVPRKQVKEELPVIVTDKLYPVTFEGNTIHHFEVNSVEEADYYLYKREMNSKHNGLVWNISELQKPATKAIPLGALIIIAKPDDIFIIEGPYATEKSPHFILPNIYISTTANSAANALEFVTVNRFMALDQLLNNKGTDRYMQLLK